MFLSHYYTIATLKMLELRDRYKSPEQLAFELYEAAVFDKQKKVAELLACNPPVNFYVPQAWKRHTNEIYSRTPAPAWGSLPFIHLVAMLSRPSILKLLINFGGKIDTLYEPKIIYETSGSILHNTLNLHTDLPIFEILVKAGADVNSKNSRGISVVTALLTTEAHNRFTGWYECEDRNGKIAILKLLIENGATPSKTDVVMIRKLVASKPITDADAQLLQLCESSDDNILQTPESASSRSKQLTLT